MPAVNQLQEQIAQFKAKGLSDEQLVAALHSNWPEDEIRNVLNDLNSAPVATHPASTPSEAMKRKSNFNKYLLIGTGVLLLILGVIVAGAITFDSALHHPDEINSDKIQIVKLSEGVYRVSYQGTPNTNIKINDCDGSHFAAKNPCNYTDEHDVRTDDRGMAEAEIMPLPNSLWIEVDGDNEPAIKYLHK